MIEACEHESLPFFGVQFHPERMTGAQFDGTTPDFAAFFAHFWKLAYDYGRKEKL